jgi:hypothetical protein
MPLVPFSIAEGIAISIAAFSLAPSIFEKGWITASALLHPNPDFRGFFVFGPISHLQRTNFQLGFRVIGFVEIVVILACAMSSWRVLDREHRMLSELAVVAFLFQVPLATVLWLYLPEIGFVQYPFRFLAVMGTVLPLVVISRGVAHKLRVATCILMAFLSMLPPLFYFRIKAVNFESVQKLAQSLAHGYPGTREYTPAGAIARRAPTALLALSVANDSQSSQCSLLSLSDGQRLKVISVHAESPCRVRIATYFYPYWQATDESGEILQTSRDDAGLLVVTVPKGRHTVQIRFHPYSPIRILSMVISLVTIVCLIVEFWKSFRKGKRESHTGKELLERTRREMESAAPASNALAIDLSYRLAEAAT